MNKAEPAVDTKQLTGKEKTLAIADARLKAIIQATSDMRTLALEDLEFCGNKQWSEAMVRDREKAERPALTINKVNTYNNQVINDIRQNKPQPKIRPKNESKKDNAMVRDGLVRNILENVESKNAINMAAQYQVQCGIGWMRVLTRYCSPDTFEQEAVLDRIENPLSVYAPLHLMHKADGSDMPHCFIRTKISKDDFAAEYPDADMTTYVDVGIGDNDQWGSPDFIYIYEYFDKEYETSDLYLLESGETTYTKPESYVSKRKVRKCKVIWRKITKNDVLDEKEFPGEYIPVIMVVGAELVVDGRKILAGLTRTQKDAQKAYNYWYTTFTEQVALQPKAPYVGYKEVFEGHEEVYRTANIRNHAYLPGNAVVIGGQLLPLPLRSQPPQGGEALLRGIELASEQMRETTGIYQADVGAPSSETSGRAINARIRQGATANYHFIENVALSVLHLGRVLNGILKIYDTERMIRILGVDMTDKIVKINADQPEADQPNYTLTDDSEQYEVIITTGPSYDTKRIEAVQNLTNFMQAMNNPQVSQVLSDLTMKQLDFPLSDEAAERLKRLTMNTMPGIIAEDDQSGDMTQQQMQTVIMDMKKLMQAHQMTMAQNQQMQAMISQLQQALKDKQGAQQVQADAAVIRAEAEIQKAKMGLESQIIHEHSEQKKHAVDTALKLDTLNSAKKSRRTGSVAVRREQLRPGGE
jgi:hypothetical protein